MQAEGRKLSLSPQKYETMLLRASLSDRTPYRKFLIVVGLTLIGAVLFTAIGSLLSNLLFGINMTGDASILDQKGNTSFRNKSDLTVSEKIGGEFDSLSENTKVRYGLDSGVLTKNITEGGELAKIGVQDRYVIMEVNGKPVNSQKDIEKILNGYSGKVQIKFVDDFGQIRTGGFKMP